MINGYRTYIGILVALVPTVASLFGYDVSPQLSEQATGLIEDGVTLAGLLIAFYGRLVATAPGWFARRPE